VEGGQKRRKNSAILSNDAWGRRETFENPAILSVAFSLEREERRKLSRKSGKGEKSPDFKTSFLSPFLAGTISGKENLTHPIGRAKWEKGGTSIDHSPETKEKKRNRHTSRRRIAEGKRKKKES